MGLALQPAGNRDSRVHYVDTVENFVDLRELSHLLGSESAELTRLYPDGQAQMWGVTPGVNDVNVSKYGKLELGDTVLFLRDKHAFAKARISLLFRNEPLADHLWGRDAKGSTWEYMYSLQDVEDIDVPYEELRAALGSSEGDNFMGFRVVTGDKESGVLALFGELTKDPADAPWDIRINQTLRRTELHDRYGGARRGGIEPSAKTPNVFLFSDPTVGTAFGYDYDGPRPDDSFDFTGDGQEGDQDPEVGGNKSLLDAEADNRAIRLFTKRGPEITYKGEYELADPPYRTEQAPDRNGSIREVLVFHLLPVDVDPEPTLTDEVQPSFVSGPIEQHLTLHFDQRRKSLGRRSTRRESALVHEYEAWCADQGRLLTGGMIQMAHRKSDLTIDIFEEARAQVIEAKSSASRIHIRQAIGQVLEYAFLMSRDLGKEISPAILTPHQPVRELCDLLTSLGITYIWKDGDEFLSVSPAP